MYFDSALHGTADLGRMGRAAELHPTEQLNYSVSGPGGVGVNYIDFVQKLRNKPYMMLTKISDKWV